MPQPERDDILHLLAARLADEAATLIGIEQALVSRDADAERRDDLTEPQRQEVKERLARMLGMTGEAIALNDETLAAVLRKIGSDETAR